MDTDEYDSIIRHLVSMLVKQDTINERVTVAIEQLTHAIDDIKTLLARNLPLSENGRDV